MSEIFKNFLANFSSRIWSVLLSLFLIPQYIKLIGVEGYGWVGIYSTLSLCLAPMDFGFGSTMKREMARLTALKAPHASFAHFAYTIELLFWGTAVLIGVVFFLLAPLVSQNWIHSTKMTPEQVERCFRLMGLAISSQWPCAFYSLSLIGLQKQIPLSIFSILTGTLGSCGLLALLNYFSPTLEALFIWNSSMHLVQFLVLHRLLWKHLPTIQEKLKFQFHRLKEMKNFAFGMAGISVTTIILTNLDKLLLSKLLALQELGHYFLATTFSKAITLITGPLFITYFPKLSQTAAVNNQEELHKSYHQGCQLVSFLAIPTGLILILFSFDIFSLWLGEGKISKELSQVAQIYTLGSLINGWMTMPYALMTSLGWTQLSFYQNLISILVFVPALFFMTSHFGILGASLSWLFLNLGYFFLSVPIMHSRILTREMGSWYLKDIGAPLLINLIFITAFRYLIPCPIQRIMKILFFLLIFTGALGITFFLSPNLRREAKYG